MKYCCYLAVFFFVHNVCYAWGLKGHRIVAEIANHRLTDKSKLAVSDILGHSNLAKISNTADTVYRAKYPQTAKWHYFNADSIKPVHEHKGQKVENIVEAFTQQLETLKSNESSREQKKMALSWVVHLAGDAHQPFHAGYKKDRGGNLCKVRWYNKITNLHHVWDTKLIEKIKLSYSEYARWIEEDHYLDKIHLNANVSEWVIESREKLNQLYPKSKKGFNYCKFSHKKRLSKVEKKNLPFLAGSYYDTMQSVLELQLYIAGVQLANILNKLYT